MSGDESCKMYKETQSSIKTLLEKGVVIDKSMYTNQIAFIKNDTASSDDKIRRAALEMLNFLLQANSQEIEVEMIKLLNDDAVNKLIQNTILNTVKQKVLKSISGKLHFVKVLSPWKNQNTNKLTNIIEDICVSDLSKDKCKVFFIETIIPSMLAINTDRHIRDALIDIAFMMSTILPISDLNPVELELFMQSVNTEYVINIGKLRDTDYPNWHNLWIFLVRFCDKHIHHSMDLTNKLLRVVEFAFRNSSVEQRLKGYNCWKELIDNASLDMNHMCSPKQIKLLITPLKAKFSKQEVVICRRFDVFTYLLEKLQHKAVLCLTEFLEFCFGCVGDNMDANKTGQGKSVRQLWIKSAKVLIELIGHSHSKDIPCLNTEDIIKLEKAVVDCSNISTYYKILINSVRECCILLKDTDMEDTTREIVIKCMWKSIFKLIIPASKVDGTKYFQLVSEILDKYLVEAVKNPYLEDVLILIFSVLMSYDDEFKIEITKFILRQLLTILFTVGGFPSSVADQFKSVVSHIFSKVTIMDEKLALLKEILIAFTKLKLLVENIAYASKIWLCAANELSVDFTVAQIEKLDEFNVFFMWPAYHLHLIDADTKRLIILYWMKLYRKITTDAEPKKMNVLKDLFNIFKSNPLLNPNIVSLLNVMSQFEVKFTKEFVNKIMVVATEILHFPNLKAEEQQKLIAVVMQYFEPLDCYKGDFSEELAKNICTCVEHILCINKDYNLLDSLAQFLKKSTASLKSKFSKYLLHVLLDLYNKETDSNGQNAKELQKVLKILNSESIGKNDASFPFIPPSGRSARIANMAKSSPKSPRKSRKKSLDSSPTALRLFGKDLETLSPLRVKGSQLNNTPKNKKIVNTPKTIPKNVPSFNDEQSSDFVPIDTEVKFQPEKLSKHQKEVLKKRREDIPALYQDLSQSVSQDMFSSASSSKDIEDTAKETSDADKQRVIVEVVTDELKATDEDTYISPLHLSSDTVEEIRGQPSGDSGVSNNVTVAAVNSEILTSDIKTSKAFRFSLPKKNTDAVNKVVFGDNSTHPTTDLVSRTEKNMSDEDKTSESSAENRSNEDKQIISETSAGSRSDGDKQTISESSAGNTSNGDKQTISESSAENVSKLVNSESQSFISPKAKTSCLEVIVKEKESAKCEVEEKKKRGRQRIEMELQKLKMDIVGAEEFLAASRRTRTREKPKKLEDLPIKRVRLSPKEDKQLSQKEQTPKKSLVVENSPFKDEITEKTSAVERAKKDEDLIQFSPNVNPEDKSHTFKDVTPPKTKQRRSWRSKSIENKANSETTNRKQLDNDAKPIRKRRMSRKLSERDDIADSQETGRDKRKRNRDDEESEDIIESSQKFHIDLTPVFNASKRRSFAEVSKTGAEPALNKSEEVIKRQRKTVTESDRQFVLEDDAKSMFSIANKLNDVIDSVVQKTTCVTEQLECNLEKDVEDQNELNMTQDTTMTQDSGHNVTHIDDITEELNVQVDGTENVCIETQQYTLTQTTLTQSQYSVSSAADQPPVIRYDLPKKPELTDSEKMMCQMDTMSMCMDSNGSSPIVCLTKHVVEETEIIQESNTGLLEQQDMSLHTEDVLSTPKSKSRGSLPSSPVTAETPTRTSELLSNTMDISPISSKSNSDDGETSQSRDSVPINFDADIEDISSIERDCQDVIIEKVFQDCPQLTKEEPHTVNVEENREMPVLFGDILTELKNIEQNLNPFHELVDEQCENYIREVENSLVPTEEAPNYQESAAYAVGGTSQKTNTWNIPSAKSSKDSNIQERASKLLNMVNMTSPKISVKKRVVTMSPSCRTKRLMFNFNQKPSQDEIEGNANEEEFLTFSREVPSPLALPRTSILKRKVSDSSDSDSISPYPKRKRVNFSDPCLTSKKVFIKDDYQSNAASSYPFDESDSQPNTEHSDNAGSERMTETENFETEPALEMVNPLTLKKDKPIYPKLINCKDNVFLILKRVTSPMFITTLMNKLKKKEIKTIGDLAKQSEAEINRFPFKVPVVPNVYKALDNYYKKNIDKSVKEGNEEARKLNEAQKDKRPGVIKETVPKVVDPTIGFKQLIQASKAEGSLDELIRVLFSSVEKHHLINFIKNQYKLDVNDFLPETEFKSAVKHITQKVGYPNMFEMLASSIESSEEESVYYDCVMKLSLEKKSLSEVWENRPLDDVRKGLEESIKKGLFSKREVIDKCLVPLIENPNDISTYLNRLSVVELNDIVVQRLQDTDFRTDFINRILDSCSHEYNVTLCKEVVAREKSSNQVISVFQHCISSQTEEMRNEIMVEMFKYISGKLSTNKLLELHIDFLSKRVSSSLGEK